MPQDNPLLNRICTRCGKNGMECQCDNFAPTISPSMCINIEGIGIKTLEINKEEAKKLLDYFMQVGYIGYELEHDLATHEFIKELREFLK